jgi:hypothetical protein
MKTVVCKYCESSHECAGRMSNAERARAAARGRIKRVDLGPQCAKCGAYHWPEDRCMLPVECKGARYDDDDGHHD